MQILYTPKGCKHIEIDSREIIIYPTLRSLIMQCLGNRNWNEVQNKTIQYYDARIGKHRRVSVPDFIKHIKSIGAWGFVGHNTNIHIWKSKRADMNWLSSLLAHEYGHTCRPFRKSVEKEEHKAWTIEKTSDFVNEAMHKLGYVWKRK